MFIVCICSLRDLHERIDTTAYDKDTSHTAITKQYRSLDISQYTLIHDGQLHWRQAKGKHVEVHLGIINQMINIKLYFVVLLDQLLILLTRHSDGNKLILKMHDAPSSKEPKWCPVLRLSSLMIKEVATGLQYV